MTYKELNDLFWATWGDDKGIIRGKPVEFICRVNTVAGTGGLYEEVDMAFLQRELDRAGLELDWETAV